MNSIILISFLSFISVIFAQNYYGCTSYYYSSYNGALCCYKRNYSYYYYYYYYYNYNTTYCPYYTTAATTTSPTTSQSNSCRSYYYSYLYSSRCCYKTAQYYNRYYSYYYYYTTSDCNLTSTPGPTRTCSTNPYSYYYKTTCCNFLAYYYSYAYYNKYCPTKYTLETLCGSICCTANVPVYNGSDVFYFSQYFCPEENYDESYCGSFCGMAIVFGLLGSCSCICGLGFTIAFFVLIGLLLNNKVRKQSNKSTYVVEHQPPPQLSTCLQDSTDEFRQLDIPPPEFHGYTYDPNPVNVPDTEPYPSQVTGTTNAQVFFNPGNVPPYSEANELLKTDNII